MLKVLISAYACEPNKGSEPGVGWNWTRQIAKFAETWVITRTNNKKVIEEESRKKPIPNLHFVYIDLPKWLGFWKRGQRGVHLYYYLWQFVLYFKAKALTKRTKFDIAHHISFVNDWMLSGLSFLHIPFVWGPIGSNNAVPREYFINYLYYFSNKMKYCLRKAIRLFDPFFSVTYKRANRVILILKNQLQLYPFQRNSICKCGIIQANAVDFENFVFERNSQNRDINIFSAGSLIPIKGFHLTLSAYSILQDKKKDMQFTISGNGPLRKYLAKLTVDLNISDSVLFTGNTSREEVIKNMQNSDIFFFPSFEGGGMVVLEAMASGLPVVCLDYGGPGEMVTEECGIKVKPVTLEQTVDDLAKALLKLVNNPELRKEMGEAGRKRIMEHYTWEKKGQFIKKVYEDVLGRKI